MQREFAVYQKYNSHGLLSASSEQRVIGFSFGRVPNTCLQQLQLQVWVKPMHEMHPAADPRGSDFTDRIYLLRVWKYHSIIPCASLRTGTDYLKDCLMWYQIRSYCLATWWSHDIEMLSDLVTSCKSGDISHIIIGSRAFIISKSISNIHVLSDLCVFWFHFFCWYPRTFSFSMVWIACWMTICQSHAMGLCIPRPRRPLWVWKSFKVYYFSLNYMPLLSAIYSSVGPGIGK